MLDIVVALLLLTLSVPILAIAALLVRIQLGSPVFFVQERTGLGQRPFPIVKLRTMSNERNAGGNLLPDGVRCRGVGRVLRRLSIDELPQLVNVLRGQLSLVGPRPLLPRYDAWYTERERRRFDVRPGITGLAQISGRNGVPWEERLALDVRYVEQWSLWLDLRILAATAGKVFQGSGVAVDPAAQMLDLDKERQTTCVSS
ncbi:undecaprenyl phosphate N,N'-diacetylbacillosamine 1-phosphate transferase [Micromonospora phaseoli]|uniref:Undecaprenyl phosphate N,N'-diacetylbacillosamine 1-phosphate transferase n=1 Tax=Micromonospora phaseoli TaxID=1144548 RepID=A0A1H6SDX8_9ACTN|nr:sugar transferase [Micromonospora phaseoli]PZW03920.1 undecaprenyl phosphate N,N'-diacetylbacillosamine 1-phosphate transferase [Micromonospora phaseoli]SEI66121.1 undecaprenyl phosphate N,N'-diacetylbacillosamine 1-phosphate transferase [Micromonospora phaseoli]